MTSVLALSVPDAAFEARLREALRSRVEFIELIGDDLVAAGGKRIRPLLTLLSAQMLGASPSPSLSHSTQSHSTQSHPTQPHATQPQWEAVLDLAVCVELLHSASLLHDDLIDDADTRRGHQAAFKRFGNVVSVMSGDFMLARLLMLLAGMNGGAALTRAFGETASVICEGEVLQFQVAAYQEYDLAHYLSVIHGKTAALTELAASAPATLLGAPLLSAGGSVSMDGAYEALRTFGREYGLAFQMQDDLLDLAGTEEQIGKPVGGDLREGKATYPSLLLLAGPHGAEVRRILERRAAKDGDVERVRELALTGGAFERTREEIRRRAALAVDALQAFPTSAARHALEDLARREIERAR